MRSAERPYKILISWLYAELCQRISGQVRQVEKRLFQRGSHQCPFSLFETR